MCIQIHFWGKYQPLHPLHVAVQLFQQHLLPSKTSRKPAQTLYTNVTILWWSTQVLGYSQNLCVYKDHFFPLPLPLSLKEGNPGKTFLHVLTLCPDLSALGLQKHSSKTQTCELDVTLEGQLWTPQQCLLCTEEPGKGVAKEPHKTGFYILLALPVSSIQGTKFPPRWICKNSIRKPDEKMNPSFRKSSFDLCPKRGSRKKVGHLQRKMVDKSDYSESPITALSIRLGKVLPLGSLESHTDG